MRRTRRSDRLDVQNSVFGAGYAHSGPGREVRSCDEPDRIVNSEASAAVDDCTIQCEHPADIALGAPVEVSVACACSGVGESGSAKGNARDGDGRKDQRLVLPSEPGIAPRDRRDAERRGGQPNTDHRRYGDLDHPENSAKDGPIPVRHQRSDGGPTAGFVAARDVPKLSRANSAIPAKDPIIDALSSGIKITFWF